MKSRRQMIKGLFGTGLFAALALVSAQAFAGTYLNRAALLLNGAELEAKGLRARFHDQELARVAHRLALARLDAGREMEVPGEVKRAHPHLLLVLESYERAAHAATKGAQTEFLVSLNRAREEASIFVAILKQSGWHLPS